MKAWRVSNVERFRQFEQDPDAELADLIADLRETMPSEAMLAGTAFHHALEHAPTGIEFDSIEGIAAGRPYRFRFCGDFDLELPAIREVRASRTFMVDGAPITISGQVDALDGGRIDDHKTTSRFDPDRYLSGYQWRMYLLIFGGWHFRWNIFEIAWNDAEQYYDVRAVHRLEQFAYPGMAADCQRLVERFARFVREYVEQPA